MRLRCVAVALAAPLLSLATLDLRAQQPIRVLRHSPPDTARPGDVITISFDRPVVGSLDRTPDAARLVSIEPTLDARIQWRDPATLRIIPAAPLVPGSRYRVRVANDFEAIDGGRLAAPYQFTILTKGPALVGGLPPLYAQRTALLDPNGKLLLTYSTAVDSATIERVARLEIAPSQGCPQRTIRYRWHGQRPLRETDDWQLQRMTWPSDTAGHGYRRVVELRPVSVLPEGCHGDIVLASLDPNDRPELRYSVATQPAFAMTGLDCTHRDCAAGRDLRIHFTAPVRRDSLLERLRLEPAVPFTIAEADAPSTYWHIRLRIVPRTTYRVRVSSSLRDVFGRPITGPLVDSVAAGDRHPTLGHQLGFFTIARARPALRITHVNVDSAELVIVPIPDSLRALALEPSTGADSVARLVSRLRDTVKHRVRLPGTFNVERITEVALPSRLIGGQGPSVFAIRARAIGRPRQATARSDPGSIEPVRPAASRVQPLAERTAIVQVSNLVAHAKVGDVGGSVLVTDARTGRPVRGALVTVRDASDDVMARGSTDSTGIARVAAQAAWRPGPAPNVNRNAPYWWYEAHARFIEVTLGTDRSVTPVRPHEWTTAFDEASRLGAWYTVRRRARASVFTDRGIYRPGDIAYVTAIVRRVQDGGLVTPGEGDSIRVRVTRADRDDQREGQTIRDTVLRVNAFGVATDSFRLASSVALSTYSVRVDAMSFGWSAAGDRSFRVAEYRPPEFKVSLAMDSTGVRFLGDTVDGRVNATYYFGAPMSGAGVRWQATISSGGYNVPGLPAGFMVPSPSYDGPTSRPYHVTLQGTDAIDAQGIARLRIPTRPDSAIGPLLVHVTTTVDDINRQPVSSFGSTHLHPSRYYIAVRDTSPSWPWELSRQRRIDILTARPDGRRVRDVPVAIAVVRQRTTFEEQSDGSSPVSRTVTDTILRDSIRTTERPVSFVFTPRTAGSYRVVFTGRDEDGNRLESVVGGQVPGRSWTPWADNLVRLPVAVDQPDVKTGDTLVVRFESPFRRAEAWVTVERDVILADRRLTVGPGETRVPIPVTDRFIPGAQVSVVLVDSGAVFRTDSTHRRIRAGYVAISVDDAPKELHVQMQAERPRYAPGDSVRVAITVRDHQTRGVRADVTVWAVDEGILALTGFGRSNPLDVLYTDASTGLMFASTANRMASLRRFIEPAGWALNRLGEFSGYGSAAANAMALASGVAVGAAFDTLDTRSTFRGTAFYIAGVTTDSAGRATMTAKLPDNVTTFRIIAIAASVASTFGSGQSRLVVTKPLLARASLPRFTRTGDAFFAGAVINNSTADSLTVRVRGEGQNITASGAATTARVIPAGRGSEVRFDWRADAAPGDTARIRLDVKGGAHTDAVTTPLPIRPPYAPRYHAVAGVARGPTAVRLLLPADIDPSKSRLTLRVGSSPAPLVRAAFDHLRFYAYECSEQLASTGRVAIAMLRLQRAGVLDSTAAPDAQFLRARLQLVSDELQRRQHPLGGIGYWTRDSWTTVWLTAYVGSFLLDARDAGAAVDSASIGRIARFVKYDPDTTSWLKEETYGNRAERQRIMQWTLAQELAVLHFLRRAGLPDVALEDRVAAASSRMSWEDRAWLTELLAHRSDRSIAREMLARVWRDVETPGIRADIPDSLLQTLGFRSHVRPVARLFRATMALAPDHPQMAALIERLVQQGKAEQARVWNSQDYAELSSALTELAIVQKTSDTGGTVTVRSARGAASGRTLLSGAASASRESTIMLGGLLERDGDAMVLPVTVEASGGPVFYVLTVDEVPLRAPTTPDAKGIIVERWFERFDDGQSVTEVKEGDLVRGRLRVTVPADREFVAVEDLLPAGLEVVDLSLRTSSLGPFESEGSRSAAQFGSRANTTTTSLPWLYGRWVNGWWSPWEHHEIRDDRVVYFARVLWKGSYTASYVARATTAGTFVRPPAHAEEMYNPSLGGRSEGGTFRVTPRE